MTFFDYPTSAGIGEREPMAFLSGATDADWDSIRAHADVRKVAAGETLIAEGVVDRSLYIIVDGTLEAVVAEGRRGRSRRISTMGAGTLLGEISFFDGQPRSAAVRAVTDTTVLQLSHESFEALAAKKPALGRAILLDIGRVLASRLRDIEAMQGS